MSLNSDIRDQAYQFFIEEAQELLQILEAGLLDLRQDHSTAKVHELMRAAHSIKGGAASVELGAIELLAHRLEDFFKALYSDDVDFDQELEGLLLQGYDCLSNPLIQQIEQGTFDEEAALLTAEPVFSALEVRLEDALKNGDSYIPSANDLGVDIVASIFEIDVVQSLEHLSTVAANSSNYDLESELQNQLDILAGFGELFNLSGFSEIIQTAQIALTQNSSQTLEIIEATVADCTIARNLVLDGDREQGGEVSALLKKLSQGSTAAETVAETAIGASPAVGIAFDDLDEEAGIWSESTFAEPMVEDLDIFAQPLAEADSSVEDVFAAIPEHEQTEDIFAQPLAEANSSVEDVFAAIPEHEQTEDIFAQPLAEADSSVEDVFAAIPEHEQTEDIFAQPLAEANSSVEDVFAAIPEHEQTEDIFAQPLAEANSSVEDVFAAILENEDIETTAKAESNPSIEDIFGAVTEQSITEATTSETISEDKATAPETRAEAVESIAEIFADLPSVKSVPDSLILPQPVKSQAKSLAKANKQAQSQAKSRLSVRVDLERLERMNNLVGELTINRNSLSLQNQQLQENVSELGQKFFRFRELTKKLSDVSDKIVLEQRKDGLRSSLAATSQVNSVYATEFDALEMDSYSDLYASLQDVLEEMVQLEESVDDITIFAKQSDRTINDQRQMLSQMRDELMWVRMLPLDQILQRFPRTIRDLSTKYHKPVELKLKGTGVLVDKAVLEKLADPLLHLLRNGFDHGIETPEERVTAGKSAIGSIEIRAYYQGNQTVIEVKDDGKGLDLTKIAQKAISKGLITSPEAAVASRETLFELIFEPGFSTADKVSEISGRGVGMNIVRSQIETLKGKITVASIPGEGSTFTLRLPLTLTIAKLLVCSLGATAFAIPSDSIEEIVIPTAPQIKIANGQKFLFFNTKLVPIYSLQAALEYNCPIVNVDSDSQAFKTIAPPEDWYAPLLLVRRGQELFALEVASLLSEQELVIKPYGKAIAAPAYTYGCTILSDGSLIPAFDGAALISSILGEEAVSVASPLLATEMVEDFTEVNSAEIIEDMATATASPLAKLSSTKTIMIIDDSTALRRTMALTLEKQGYRVIQKKDGKEGIDGFRNNQDLDLIICDVEMPIMNGFEFLGMRRRDTEFLKVPTFMLTSRSGIKHRNLAMQLGADGYFTKPYVEQEFVAEIKKILDDRLKPTALPTTAPKTHTVLVIDDSSALRRTLALSLEQKGYRVLQGRDGVEGLDLLRNQFARQV